MNTVYSPLAGTTKVMRSAAEIADFVDESTIDSRAYYGDERRTETRHALAIAIGVTPVDDRGTPTGDRFAAVTRDMSRIGMALFHTSEFAGDYLRVEFSTAEHPRFQVVLEVLRCRPIGPLWEIAGRFLTEV